MIKAFVYGAIVTGISIGAGMIGYSAEGITGTLFCAGAAMIVCIILLSMYD